MCSQNGQTVSVVSLRRGIYTSLAGQMPSAIELPVVERDVAVGIGVSLVEEPAVLVVVQADVPEEAREFCQGMQEN